MGKNKSGGNKGVIIVAMGLAFAALMWSDYAEKNPSILSSQVTERTGSEADKPKLQVSVEDILEGQPIPEKYAYCIATGDEKSSMTGKNISPAVRWSKGPEGTKSYAVIVVDKDVPTEFKDAGVEGKTLPISMKRRDFFHWGAIGIAPEVVAIKSGDGKAADSSQTGIQALNDYVPFMKDKAPATFRGYDGPCPPWNDDLIHRYYFYVFALSKEFTAADFPNAKNGMVDAKDIPLAIAPYILAKGSVMGTYTLNPGFKKQ